MMAYVALEDYACDGCRASGFDGMDCGCCPSNGERIREWERKYGSSSSSNYEGYSGRNGLFCVEP